MTYYVNCQTINTNINKKIRGNDVSYTCQPAPAELDNGFAPPLPGQVNG